MSEATVSPSEGGALLGRGIWRFAQLLAVGFAWSAPLLLAVFAGFGLGDYAHPRLARLFAHYRWPLLIVMLALACLGIALVAPLLRRPTRVRLIWLLVPAAIALAFVAACFMAPFAALFVFWLPIMVVPLLVVCLGAAVTTVALWRRSRWLGITWLCCWLGAVAFLVYATSETGAGGGPGDGLVALPVIATLVAAVIVTATLASLLCGVSDWTDHVRRIEQGVPADSQKLASGT